MPGINNNPAYSDNSSQTSDNLEITADQLLANGVSPEASIEVIDHFGPDTAAGILNNYACEYRRCNSATNGQLNEAAGLLQGVIC